MATVTGGHRFEISHKSGTPDDPNLCSADDIAAYMLIDSVAISTATSKAVSTVNAAAPDSSSISQARSQAVSAASIGSIADSKAVSVSGNTSVADSKAISVSGSTSQADSKAVSVANSVPILTVVAASQSVSTADSKATSAGTVLGTISAPAVIPSQGRTVTNLSTYFLNNATFNIKDFGAVGNASALDAAKVQDAVNAAIAAGIGQIFVPPGARYLLESAITCPSAISFVSIGVPAGGVNDSATGGATFLKNHAGDGFVWNGANGLVAGSGGGMENIRIVQVSGTPATTAGLGSALRLTAVDANHKPSWMVFRNVRVEEVSGTYAPWYQAIFVDGTASRILDLYFDLISSHTTGSTGGAGAVRLDGATQPWFSNSNFFDTGALISVGPTTITADAHFSNCQALTWALDHAQSAHWTGGIVSNLTDTANTTGDTLFRPGRWSGSFTPLGGGAVGTVRYRSTINVGGSLGGFDFGRPIQIPNAKYFSGVNFAGTGSVQGIGIDVNDAVRINPAADAIIALGAAPSFSGLVAGDTLVGGKLKVNGALVAASTVQVQSAGFIRSGTGAPESVVTGWVSDLYLRTDGAGATSLYVKESGNGTTTGWKAIAASGDAATFGASTLGATSATSLTVANAFGHQGTTAGFYNVAPVVRAAAITAPTAPSAGYVQAEATSMKTAVDAIRVALQNIGITL